jgi:acetate---CoA ligase (ADP-forming)
MHPGRHSNPTRKRVYNGLVRTNLAKKRSMSNAELPLSADLVTSISPSPASIAVVGASSDPLRIGGRPIAYMRRQGFRGEIMPVNPQRDRIQGLRAYPSVSQLPVIPECAIIAVSGEAAVAAAADLAALGTKLAIVFSSGFAEVGPVGIGLQHSLVEAARGARMRIIGPNSLGMFSPGTGFYATFSSSFESGFPKAGRLGIASQSGAFGAHLMCLARSNNLGISSMIMTGNESDLQVADVLDWLVQDPNTDVIALFLEGVSDGDKLMRALTLARDAHKPVIAMKTGRSALGKSAAQSHTAAIASNDAVVDAVFREFGVVRAHSGEELIDVARVASKRIYPRGNTLGVITVSGGAGVLIADAAEAAGLPMPQLPAAAEQKLKKILPYAGTRNPIDCTAQFLNDMSLVGAFGDVLVGEGGYSFILGFFSYAAGAPSVATGLLAALGALREKYADRLFVLSILAGQTVVDEYERHGFVTFSDPARAVNALAAVGRIGVAWDNSSQLPPPAVPALELPLRSPTEADSKTFLQRAGIACPPEMVCRSAQEAVAAAAILGYPVVLKVLSADIAHKSDVGGVQLDNNNADAVNHGFQSLLERVRRNAPDARVEGVLVARQLLGGVAECVMGVHRDPIFGPIAMFGLGGIFVEVLNDVVLRRCPFGVDVAEAMIRSIRGASLLLGARGRPVADISALSHMLATLSAVAAQTNGRLNSIDLNPVIVMPAGQGAYAVDAAIELRS